MTAGLYDPAMEVPLLHGNRCALCGTGYFPAIRFGCEVCGADETQLRDEEFSGDGELWARAKIADPNGGHYVIAEIALVAGPKIRVVLDDDDARTGDTMVAVWSTVDDDVPIREPRWVRATDQA